MNNGRQIEISRRIYARLLGLYPREYRKEYGTEMERLFKDQCKEAGSQGRSGLLRLWLRTLADLFITVPKEHFSSPNSWSGLLQASPEKPLPWKGVVLVLVPGLAVFIAQLGQLNGKDWFFNTLSWAAYVFLIPVGLTWILTRKFPVWGFIPVGLAFYTYIYRGGWGWSRLYDLSLLFILPLKRWLQPGKNVFIGDGWLGVPILALILFLILGWIVYRRQKFSRGAWVWLSVYAALVSLTPIIGVGEVLKKYSFLPKFSIFHSAYIGFIIEPFLSNFVDMYPAIFLLILIFLGTFLARKHGAAATLLLMGYLLPVMVFGTYIIFPGGLTDTPLPTGWINTVVFTYRLCVALIAPIWLVRVISKRGQTLAVMIPVMVAIFSQIGLQIASAFAYNDKFYRIWPLNSILYTFMPLLEVLAGCFLAIELYWPAARAAKILPVEAAKGAVG